MPLRPGKATLARLPQVFLKIPDPTFVTLLQQQQQQQQQQQPYQYQGPTVVAVADQHLEKTLDHAKT